MLSPWEPNKGLYIKACLERRFLTIFLQLLLPLTTQVSGVKIPDSINFIDVSDLSTVVSIFSDVFITLILCDSKTLSILRLIITSSKVPPGI